MVFINRQGDLTEEGKMKRKHVKILIVDEISFMKDKEIMNLDKHLEKNCDKNGKIGGMSIIFAGDFRQLETLGST